MTQLQTVNRTVPTGTVSGHIDGAYESVLDAFIENFEMRGEIGAALCICHEGETVVDLWGGSANPREERPWTEDTVASVFSCTKGALAIVAQMLVDRGQLDLNAPVTDLWPEYGRHGKDKTTVRMMLDHTAGVPALRARIKDGGTADWNYMVERIADEAPFFEPGTRSSYHGLTFAWTVGEVIRRACGQSAGQFFRETVATPLGLEFWIGLPEDIEPRVARMLKPRLDPSKPLSRFAQALRDRDSIPALFYLNDGGFNPNKELYRRAEIGSASGVTNARSLARMYNALAMGGTLDGARLMAPERIEAMRRVTNASHYDETLCLPLRIASGVMCTVDNRHICDPPSASIIMSDTAFGHGGNGGSMGFADPENGLSFGYVMNQMGQEQLINDRGQTLIDAAYRALGFRTNEGGAWTGRS